MKITFLGQRYLPEDISAAILISELAIDLAKRGHQVSIVTEVPNYPLGQIFDGYRNAIYQTETMDGVKVIRTWSYIAPGKKFWPRVLNYGSYSATAFYGGLFAGKPDVLVSYSPPLPLGMTAWALSKLWGIPWVLQIEDLFPDAAVAAGVMTNQRVINFFSAMERFEYKRANHISIISEAFRENLRRKAVPDDKMTLIPVWADPDLVCPMPKENNFRKQNGLEGKFVLIYAGNVGFTSSLEDIIGAAEILRENDQIRFVIIGEGVKKDELIKSASEKGLNNIQFLPFTPRETFAEMLAAADLSIVTINKQSAHSSLPSKVFNIMASARPILAVAPEESDLGRVVQGGQSGIVVPPDDPAAIARAILDIQPQSALQEQMGLNGRALLENSYSRKHCVDQYEQMLIKILRQHGKGKKAAISPGE